MANIGEVVYSSEYCNTVLSWLKNPARVDSFRRAAKRYCKSDQLTIKHVDRSLKAWGLT